MKTIHELDKQSLQDYVKLINEDQGKIKITLSFKQLAADKDECCHFTINGKLRIVDEFNEAVSFLDGIMVACDEIFIDSIS